MRVCLRAQGVVGPFPRVVCLPAGSITKTAVATCRLVRPLRRHTTARVRRLRVARRRSRPTRPTSAVRRGARPRGYARARARAQSPRASPLLKWSQSPQRDKKQRAKRRAWPNMTLYCAILFWIYRNISPGRPTYLTFCGIYLNIRQGVHH